MNDPTTITPDPDRDGVLIHLPEITYLDTQPGAVDIGLPTSSLAALRAALDEPGPDREQRIPLDDLTSNDLDQLYGDLDRYEEVLGDLNETLVHRAKRAGRAQAALTRARDACNQLHRAAVLADGQPHTDRERGIVQAVTRVRAALDQPETTRGCGHCGHPADWHDEYEGCVGPYGIGEPGSGDCTCTRSPDTASAPAVTEATDEVQQLRAELAAIRARLADYENRITWHTTCANCARLLDTSIRETDRAEHAEATVTRVRALRDAWLRMTLEPGQVRRLLDDITRALDAPDVQPTPAATEATHPTSPKDTP